jgi:hypothetical protein
MSPSTRWAALTRSGLLIVALALGSVAVPGIANAAPPANDDFDGATVVGSLPFTTTTSTVEATSAADDPYSCYYVSSNSVWFAFTPATDMTIRADTSGSNYTTVLSGYTGSRGALQQVSDACNSNGPNSSINFRVSAGTTYYFMVSSYSYYGGSLTFSVNAVVPPENDNFANAMAITGVPFTNHVDTTAATMEPNEQTYTCDYVSHSVWYAFTPTETMSLTARVNQYNKIITVFTGSSLANLTQVGCNAYGDPLPFRAVAGQTYYFQVGTRYGSGTTLDFSLAPSPPINASFYYYPSNPSSYDTVSFYSNIYDPVYAPITSVQWQFGDGTTGTGSYPQHRYSVDGDYTVRMDVATADGRTGSATRVVQVRTHDVSIDRFLVPESATAGQTRSLSVYVKNIRYDENVTVTLYRGGVSGFTQVGSLTQYVAARPNRTTLFTFNYTFTPDDAALGQVTFKAEATLVNANDALPSNNTVISTPTTVH